MENNPWKMPERCVAPRCSNVADREKHISMHKIPFFGEKCPIKQKSRKRWIDFVLERRKMWVPGKMSSFVLRALYCGRFSKAVEHGIKVEA